MVDITLEFGCFLFVAPFGIGFFSWLVHHNLPELNFIQYGAAGIFLFGVIYMILQRIFGSGSFE